MIFKFKLAREELEQPRYGQRAGQTGQRAGTKQAVANLDLLKIIYAGEEDLTCSFKLLTSSANQGVHILHIAF
jgi:hypothetical protein